MDRESNVPLICFTVIVFGILAFLSIVLSQTNVCPGVK